MNSIESVVFAVNFLLESHHEPATIGALEIERAVSVAKALEPSVDAALLRRDVELVLETSGAALFKHENRGRRDEIIRGALR